MVVTIEMEISVRLRKEWEIKITEYETKLNESYDNLKQAEQYIEHLLAKIQELEGTIELLNKQIS